MQLSDSLPTMHAMESSGPSKATYSEKIAHFVQLNNSCHLPML
jgi:hypothetical protein